MLYNKVFPYDMTGAVIQQEMILCLGALFSVHPEIFQGILKVRIGWIIQAMKLELRFSDEDEEKLYELPPSGLKNLLHCVLCKLEFNDDFRSPIWRRMLDGALNRVPSDFYNRMWHILERIPGGIKVAGYLLPQQPTLSDMTLYELNFMLLVEQMLSKIADPAYRQIVVETFMVVSTILKRNPELEFSKTVDVDKLIRNAVESFHKDRGNEKRDSEKQLDMTEFFNTPPYAANGTTSYIAKAIVDEFLSSSSVLVEKDDLCTIS